MTESRAKLLMKIVSDSPILPSLSTIATSIALSTSQGWRRWPGSLFRLCFGRRRSAVANSCTQNRLICAESVMRTGRLQPRKNGKLRARGLNCAARLHQKAII